MATAATDPNVTTSNPDAAFDRFFAALGQGINAYLERLSRADEVARLEAMSEADLAKLGIRDRTDIVRYVFRDKFYA